MRKMSWNDDIRMSSLRQIIRLGSTWVELMTVRWDTRSCHPQTSTEGSGDVGTPASVPKGSPQLLCISHINTAKTGQLLGAGDAEDVFDDDFRISSHRRIIRLGYTLAGLMEVAMKTLELLTLMFKRGCFTQSQRQEYTVNSHVRVYFCGGNCSTRIKRNVAAGMYNLGTLSYPNRVRIWIRD
jgi:hypothetical protein